MRSDGQVPSVRLSPTLTSPSVPAICPLLRRRTRAIGPSSNIPLLILTSTRTTLLQTYRWAAMTIPRSPSTPTSRHRRFTISISPFQGVQHLAIAMPEPVLISRSIPSSAVLGSPARFPKRCSKTPRRWSTLVPSTEAPTHSPRQLCSRYRRRHQRHQAGTHTLSSPIRL